MNNMCSSAVRFSKMHQNYDKILEKNYKNIDIPLGDLTVKNIDNFKFDILCRPNLRSQLTKKISVNVPFISDPSLTNAETAIKMATCGGFGIIQRSSCIKKQVKEVLSVKSYVFNNFKWIRTMADGADLERYKYSTSQETPYDDSEVTPNVCHLGHYSIVTKSGKTEDPLMGIVTSSDFDRFRHVPDEELRKVPLNRIMTPVSKMLTVKYGTSMEKVMLTLLAADVDKIPILDNCDMVKSMLVRVNMKESFPSATWDAKRQLMVGAAVGVDRSEAERVTQLVNVGVDAILIEDPKAETAQHCNMVKYTKSIYPDLQVIAGHVQNVSDAIQLLKSGADSLLINSNHIKVNKKQFPSFLYTVARIAKFYDDTPVIVSGHLVESTDSIFKMLSLGANTVFLDWNMHGASMHFVHKSRLDERFKISFDAYTYSARVKRNLKKSANSAPRRLESYLATLQNILCNDVHSIGVESMKTLKSMLHTSKLRFKEAERRESYVKEYFDPDNCLAKFELKI